MERDAVQDELSWIKQMIGTMCKFIQKFQKERIALKQRNLEVKNLLQTEIEQNEELVELLKKQL